MLNQLFPVGVGDWGATAVHDDELIWETLK